MESKQMRPRRLKVLVEMVQPVLGAIFLKEMSATSKMLLILRRAMKPKQLF